MLAVKHIHLSGHEEIRLANRVSYQPPSHATDIPAQADKCVWIDNPDGSTSPLYGGTIFVMNELGKTVSRYDLGASMVPFGVDPLKGALSEFPEPVSDSHRPPRPMTL